MKGDIAPYAVFIVILIGMMIFIILAVTFHWLDNILPDQANRFGCNTKLINYCTEWRKNDFGATPYTYADKKPTDCFEFTGVPDSGPDEGKCRELMGIK